MIHLVFFILVYTLTVKNVFALGYSNIIFITIIAQTPEKIVTLMPFLIY